MVVVVLLLMIVAMKPSEIKQFVFITLMKTNCFISDGLFSRDYALSFYHIMQAAPTNRYKR